MNIHLWILIFIFSILFESSEAEKKNRNIEDGKKKLSAEVENLNIQREILSLLRQIKNENSKGIEDTKKTINKNFREISEGIEDMKKTINENGREISDGVNKLSMQLEDIKKIFSSQKKINPFSKKIISSSRNCFDIRTEGDIISGIRTVYPYLDSPETGVDVVCDLDTDGGGWTVFQRRDNLTIREDFNRNWSNYSKGFGNLTGEFWMGLNLIHVMTKRTDMDLRINMMDDEGDERYAHYESFSVEDDDHKFRLNIGAYSGSAGNSLKYHNQKNFSTFDDDNDSNSDGNCAEKLQGGWWFGSCLNSNLNGFQYIGNHSFYEKGINWIHFRGDYNSLVKSKMMFRPHRSDHL